MKSYTKFDGRTLEYIRKDCTAEGRSMLHEKLVITCDESRSLLHQAAYVGNAMTAKELIKLGVEVNILKDRDNTPLDTTVLRHHEDIAKMLLQNVAINPFLDDGRSLLQIALDVDRYSFHIVNSIVDNLKTNNCTSEDVAKLLIGNGCNMHHAAVLGDISVMESMLQLGLDIESENLLGITGLVAAIQLNYLNMVEWLVDRGANINAVDRHGFSVLIRAVKVGHKDIVKFLLNKGADPNYKGSFDYLTPFFAVFDNCKDGNGEFTECAELLLQYGAVPRPAKDMPLTMFDFALDFSMYETIHVLIGHLAILEFLETPTTKSVMHCHMAKYRSKLLKFEKFHNRCLRILNYAVFEKLSLFNLLHVGEREMKKLMRNEKFVSEVEKFCTEQKMSKLYSYYYRIVMRRISETGHIIELENKVTFIITTIFKSNYGKSYIFAKKVIDYLSVSDLENLVQV